jgi:hypothetical protein
MVGMHIGMALAVYVCMYMVLTACDGIAYRVISMFRNISEIFLKCVTLIYNMSIDTGGEAETGGFDRQAL